MKIGTIESPTIIDGTWQVIHDSGELASAVTDYDITDLDGDTDIEYKLIVRQVVGGANGTLSFRFNNDTSTIYGYQEFKGIGSNATTTQGTTSINRFYMSYNANSVGDIIFGEAHIYAKQGYIRTALTKWVGKISGTTVGECGMDGCVYNKTDSNITSIQVLGSVASGLGVGTRIILMRKVTADGLKTGDLEVQGKVYGVWQEVSRKEVTGSAIDSHAFTDLDGDTDVLYRLVIRGVNNYDGACTTVFQFNDDTANNYGYQQLYATNTTVTAANYTSKYNFSGGLVFGSDLNDLYQASFLIYAKSGYVRSVIMEGSSAIMGTTVGYTALVGASWNNTANEIISLKVSNTEATGLGVGTVIILERLNL